MRNVVLALALFMGTVPARAQYKPGPQDVTFFSSVDDSDQPYALYVPKNFNPAKRYPLVIMLHGASSNHRLALRRVFGLGNKPDETDVEATREFPQFPDVDYIVASPLARGTLGYQGIPEKDVLDVVSDVEARFPIDLDRIYLTGLSMGGGGTLWLGLSRPDMWAAIAPVCPAPPKEASALAPNAVNLPIHIYQGGADPVVPPQQTRDWVANLKKGGAKLVEYDEYPGVQHNSWDNAYADGQIFKWFAQFRRDAWPKHVHFASADYQHQKAYWVVLDRIEPGTTSEIDAQFTGTNSVDVKTTRLNGFSLMLYAHPSFQPGKPMTVTVDGKAIAVPPITSTVSFAKTATGWKLGDNGPGDDEKQQGSEGPLRAALSGRHIYVYGTRGNPSKAELARREQEAKRDASWAPLGTKLELWLRAVADKNVRPSDWDTSDLVLLGTKETNSIIADVSKTLPMELSAAARGWNLTFIWPHDRHYVLVSSGADIAGEGMKTMLPFLPVTGFPNAVFGLGDYVLFHNGQKIVEGRFAADWKIPAADAEKLKASGVVTLRSEASKQARSE